MLRRARDGWPFDAMDMVALLGLLLVGAGLALVWVPLAAIVVGAVLLGAALFAALPARRGDEP